MNRWEAGLKYHEEACRGVSGCLRLLITLWTVDGCRWASAIAGGRSLSNDSLLVTFAKGFEELSFLWALRRLWAKSCSASGTASCCCPWRFDSISKTAPPWTWWSVIANCNLFGCTFLLAFLFHSICRSSCRWSALELEKRWLVCRQRSLDCGGCQWLLCGSLIFSHTRKMTCSSGISKAKFCRLRPDLTCHSAVVGNHFHAIDVW